MFQHPLPTKLALNTNEVATLEVINDKIRDHLTNQRAPSRRYRVIRTCYYRAEDEAGQLLMCAVGCLINDSQYSEELEQKTAANLSVLDAVLLSLASDGLPVPDIPQEPHYPSPFRTTLSALLMNWQDYHDSDSYSAWCSGNVNEPPPGNRHAYLAEMLKRASQATHGRLNKAIYP